MTAVRVLSPGGSSFVQDSGRLGYRDLGVATSGAFDRAAFAAANRSLGNAPTAAVIECTLGGLELIAQGEIAVAVAGADVELSHGSYGERIDLSDGEIFKLGRAKRGLRVYLAVSGGFDADVVLGSRSHDTMSLLGPPPLRPGDIARVVANGSSDNTGRAIDPHSRSMRVFGGPHADVVSGGAEALLAREWTVSPNSSRIGVRLETNSPVHVAMTVPPQPTLPGAVQLTPSGELIVLGPDGPTTGGYPVVAVVHDVDLDQFAQLRPGQRITNFEMVS